MRRAFSLLTIAGFVLLGSILNTGTTNQIQTASDIKAGIRSDTFVHGTTTYSYTTHIPKAPLNEKIPLLLVFPGGDDTATGIMQKTDFNTLADKRGFIATYITNPRSYWSGVQKGNEAVRMVDADITFLPEFIEALSEALPIDRTRIYGVGFSTGSLYIQEMTCRTNIFAAIAPVSGVDNLSRPCTKTPVIMWHETASNEQFIESPWIKINQCDSVKEQRSLQPLFGTTTVSARTFSDCTKDVSVYNVHGGAHKWPDMSFMQNGAVTSITPEQIMWNFMSKYTNTE